MLWNEILFSADFILPHRFRPTHCFQIKIPPASLPDPESSPRPRGLSQHPPSSSDSPPSGGSRETELVDKRDKVQQSEENDSREAGEGEGRGGGGGGCDDRGNGGGGDGSPVDHPVDQQLIVELEETEEDIVNTLQVCRPAKWLNRILHQKWNCSGKR